VGNLAGWLSDVGGKVIWVTNGRDHSPTAVRKIKAGSQGAGTPSQAVIDYLAVPTRPDGPQSDRPTDGNARGTGTDLSCC